tara:strand:- start:542 stop:772 length:231 start_codon:yes stop_codon:yes gene_type:complete
VLIVHPVLLNIVAGPAFSGLSENTPFVELANTSDMEQRIKVLMNMAALTIIANYLIGFPWTQTPSESFLNFHIRAS